MLEMFSKSDLRLWQSCPSKFNFHSAWLVKNLLFDNGSGFGRLGSDFFLISEMDDLFTNGDVYTIGAFECSGVEIKS